MKKGLVITALFSSILLSGCIYVNKSADGHEGSNKPYHAKDDREKMLSISAGRIGCQPEQINITEISGNISWIATCKEKRFVCATYDFPHQVSCSEELTR